MGLHREYEDRKTQFDVQSDESMEEISRKKQVRHLLESRLEHKRLKEELEDYEGELDDEFDWDKF